jgi:predicted Mrr-cat superfamily restriction endonuclease
MKNYYRLMLGKGSEHAQACIAGNFIGVGFIYNQDLTNKLPDEWRAFNREFIPVYLESHPGKSKVAAGLACGAVWTVSKGLNIGDIVISPDGEGHYHVGEVTGNYYHQSDTVPLPHRRPVHWFSQTINRADMSENLRKSSSSAGTVSNISTYGEEIERLIGGVSAPKLVSTDETVENASEFAMEKHLEDFLVQNWKQTEFGKDFNIFEEEDEIVGQQYPTDTGPIDILAVSKDKKTLLVIELKKGRASDVVVGQTLRYMGFVKDELAEEGQIVKGVIIALEDDQRIRRALAMVPNIEFYRYQVSFKLVRA